MTDPVLISLSLGVFFVAAVVQATTGFGAALVAVPLLALAMDPISAIVAATLTSLFISAFAATRERADVEFRRATLLTGAAFVGMPLGIGLLATVGTTTLTRMIGGVLLFLIVCMLTPLSFPLSPGFVAGWGLSSGALLTSTGMNGPPLVMALQDLTPKSQRATLQATFVAQDVAALALLTGVGHVSLDVLLFAGTGLTVMPLGWRCGDRLFECFAPRQFKVAVLVGLTLTGVYMLATACPAGPDPTIRAPDRWLREP